MNPTQIDYIHYKIKEFVENHSDEPKRLILGRNTYYGLINLMAPYAIYPTNLRCGRYGQFHGLEISLSKRENYVRVLPQKMKYNRRYSRQDYINENL